MKRNSKRRKTAQTTADVEAIYQSFQSIRREVDALKSEEKSISTFFQEPEDKPKPVADEVGVDDAPYDPEDSKILLDSDLGDLPLFEGSISSISLSEGEIIDCWDIDDEPDAAPEEELEELELRRKCLKSLEARATPRRDVTNQSRRRRRRARPKRRKSHLQVSGILATVSSHKSHRERTDAFLEFTGVGSLPLPFAPPLPPTIPPPPPPPPPPLPPSTHALCFPFEDQAWSSTLGPLFGSQDVDLRDLPSNPTFELLDNYECVRMEVSDDEMDIARQVADEAETEPGTLHWEEELNLTLRQLRNESDHDIATLDKEEANETADQMKAIEQSSAVSQSESSEQLDVQEVKLREKLLQGLALREMNAKKPKPSDSPPQNMASETRAKPATSSAPETPRRAPTISTVVTSTPLVPAKESAVKAAPKATRAAPNRVPVKPIQLPTQTVVPSSPPEKFVIVLDDESSDEESRVRKAVRGLDPNASLEEFLSMKKRFSSCMSNLHTKMESGRRAMNKILSNLSSTRKQRITLAEKVMKEQAILEMLEHRVRSAKTAETRLSHQLSRIQEDLKDQRQTYSRMWKDLKQIIGKIRNHPQAEKANQENVIKPKLATVATDPQLRPQASSLRRVESAPTLKLIEPRIDPFKVICPFSLHGRCLGADCLFQHPVFPSSPSLESLGPGQENKHHSLLKGVGETPMLKPSANRKGLCTTFRCIACDSILSFSTLHFRSEPECRSCISDPLQFIHHSLYRISCTQHQAKTLKNLKNSRQLRLKLLEAVKEYNCQEDVTVDKVKHCLLGWLVAKDMTKEENIYASALAFVHPQLKALSYAEDLVWFLYDKLLSYPARQSLLLSALAVAKLSSCVTFALKLVIAIIQLECITGHSAVAVSFLHDLLRGGSDGWVSSDGRMYLWCLCVYLRSTNDAPSFPVTGSKTPLIHPSEFLSFIRSECLHSRGLIIKSVISEAFFEKEPQLSLEDVDFTKIRFDSQSENEAYFALLELNLRLFLYNVPVEEAGEEPTEEERQEEEEGNRVFDSVFLLCCHHLESPSSDEATLPPCAVRLFVFFLTRAFKQATERRPADWNWFAQRCQNYGEAYKHLLPLFVYMKVLAEVTDGHGSQGLSVLHQFTSWLFGLAPSVDAAVDPEELLRIYLGLKSGCWPSDSVITVTRHQLEASGAIVYVWLSLGLLLHLKGRPETAYSVLTQEAVPRLLRRTRDVCVSLCFALWVSKAGLSSGKLTATEYFDAVKHCLLRASQLNAVASAREVINEVDLALLPSEGDGRHQLFTKLCSGFGQQAYPLARLICGSLIFLRDYRSAFHLCQDLSSERDLPFSERFWLVYMRSAQLCDLDHSIQLQIMAQACEKLPMSIRLWLTYRKMADIVGAKSMNEGRLLITEIDEKLVEFGLRSSEIVENGKDKVSTGQVENSANPATLTKDLTPASQKE